MPVKSYLVSCATIFAINLESKECQKALTGIPGGSWYTVLLPKELYTVQRHCNMKCGRCEYILNREGNLSREVCPFTLSIRRLINVCSNSKSKKKGVTIV